MSRARRLAALFVAPAQEAPTLRLVPPPSEPKLVIVEPLEASLPTAGAAAGLAAGAGASADAGAGGVVVVVGGGRAGVALAAAICSRLAACAPGRTAMLEVPAEDAALVPRTAAVASRAARRLAQSLPVAAEATVRGRIVEVREVTNVDAPGVPLVRARQGARQTSDDPVLAAADRVVVNVIPGAAAALTELAVAELRLLAPTATVVAVTLPVRLGPAARRRLLRVALGAPA